METEEASLYGYQAQVQGTPGQGFIVAVESRTVAIKKLGINSTESAIAASLLAS
jgi:hypothetical protein